MTPISSMLPVTGKLPKKDTRRPVRFAQSAHLSASVEKWRQSAKPAARKTSWYV